MIATIIIVSLAFIWLGYETDWMRVRLPAYGLPANWLAFDWTSWKSWMEPICGWDWIQFHHHPIPEYKVQLVAPGYKTTITSHSTSALRDAFRINRNPYLKINLGALSYSEMMRNRSQFAKV